MTQTEALAKLKRVMRYMSAQIHLKRIGSYADAIWNAGFIVGEAFNELSREVYNK